MTPTRLQLLGIALLLAALAWVPLFYHLDQNTASLWDESRVGANAMEMCESGSLIVTTYQGEPDHWFVKPPLMVWATAATMKLLGYKTLALRLPAAVAALSILYMFLWFSIRVLRDWRIGLFASLALLTIRGFVSWHVARTGDVDAMLLAFMALFWIAWLCYLYGPAELKNRSIWVSALGLCLAYMSKSTAVFFTLPGLALWLLRERQALAILRNWRFHVAYLLAILLPVLYYVAREAADPGFMAIVWDSEFLGRLGEASATDSGTFFHYFNLLYFDFLFPYVYLLPLLIVMGLREWKGERAKVLLAALAMGIACLLLISVTSFKRDWYPAQLYPLVALIMGIGLWEIWVLLSSHPQLQKRWVTACCMVLLCLAVFGQNYFFIYRRNTHLDEAKYPVEAAGYAMREIRWALPDEKNYQLAVVGHPGSAYFHTLQARLEHGEKHPIYDPKWISSDTGAVILSCDSTVNDSLSQVWSLDTLWNSDYNCLLLRLNPAQR